MFYQLSLLIDYLFLPLNQLFDKLGRINSFPLIVLIKGNFIKQALTRLILIFIYLLYFGQFVLENSG